MSSSALRSWLKPDGRFFMHIFTHRAGTYLFDCTDREDWIAQHFFTGGVMPSHHLIRQYADLFSIEKEWRWSATQYQRTAMEWLANFDAHASEIEAVLRTVYGNETQLWMRRCAGSSSRPPACSATPMATNGASAITG
jgi:cyclopropane-fatty-acyl-phospholipid synthase